jgi:hypothetical protein
LTRAAAIRIKVAMKRAIAILGLALTGLTGPSYAESVVWFADGRTMTVESLQVEDGLATLELPGGGSLVLPAGRIDRHAFLPPPPPPRPAVGSRDAWARLAGPYADSIGRAAREYGLDPALLAAVAAVESGFDPDAVSYKGAEGLLQLMPATARRFGVEDSFDADQNVHGGARYLGWLLERFSGDEGLALAGYNAGEGAVDRYLGIPPYPETEQYVDRVLTRAASLRSLAP